MLASALPSLADRARAVIAAALQMPASAIAPNVALTTYGLDSVSALELTAALEPLAGRALPDWLVAEHPTLAELVQAIDLVHASPPGGTRSSDETERALIAADSRLPGDIRPAALAALQPARHILLTGATGFLGGYLLAQLVRTTDAHVHCLVRPNSRVPQLTASRAQLNLERYGLWDPAMRDRTTIVEGDVTLPRFGLDAVAYRALAERVDAVYHAAGDVSWVQPYAALRATNVLGTVEVLRFAAAQRVKPMQFISSLSVCYATGGPASVDEATDMTAFVHDLPLGYAKSKVVAESLVQQAIARGLPARIFRPSVIVGDSATGASNLDDIVALLLKGCIEMGTAPDLDWVIDGPPVDHVARAVVRLATGIRAANPAVLHLAADRPRHWRECVLWTRLFGYDVRLAPFAEWQAQLRRDAADAAHPLHALRPFFLRTVSNGLTAAELLEDRRRSATTRTLTREAEAWANLLCPRLDAQAMDRYFHDFVARDFLKVQGVKGYLRPDFSPAPSTSRFHAILAVHFGDPALRVTSCDLLDAGSDHSIVSELTSWRRDAHHGLFHHRVSMISHTAPASIDVMAKCKPADVDVIAVAEAVGDVCGGGLGDAIRQYERGLGLRASDLRELAIYESAPPKARALMPVCYGMWQDEALNGRGLLLERLDDVELLNTADEPDRWTVPHIDIAIAGLAELHAAWRPPTAALRAADWIGDLASTDLLVETRPLWRVLAAHARPFVTGWTGARTSAIHHDLVESIGQWSPVLDASPTATLIHHDFNPRNICLRPVDGALRLCAYDWELATIGAPQRDLAELLCFVLSDRTTPDVLERHVEHHRAQLSALLGEPIDATAWRAGFRSALADMLVRRLAFYTMINRVRPQRFLPRVVRTWAHLFDLSGRSL